MTRSQVEFIRRVDGADVARARVVDENIETAERGERRLDGSAAPLDRRQRSRRGNEAVLAVDLLDRLVHALGAAAVQRHAGPRREERFDDAAANAARAAGHQDALVGEVDLHHPSPFTQKLAEIDDSRSTPDMIGQSAVSEHPQVP